MPGEGVRLGELEGLVLVDSARGAELPRASRSGREVRMLDRRGSEQVVIKLKPDGAVRESLRNLLSVRRPNMLAVADPIGNVLSTPGLRAVEPLFPQAELRSTFGERFLMALPEERDELGGMSVLTFDTPREAVAAVAELSGDERIAYAHVIPPRFLFAASPARKKASKRGSRRPVRRGSGLDPLTNRQWGLTAIELAKAQGVAGFEEPDDIVIAVVDSGVDPDHPDLAGVVLDAQNFTPGAARDTQGHGTHVIGIIAAVRNNALGITGVCKSRKVLSLKALGPYDGPGYYRAIRHATDAGARVANFSLGGGHDPTEELLVRRAIERGVIVIAAMGNEYESGNPVSYPAAIDGVIAVGATDESDRRASFSQTGPHIHVMAPGVNILSTVPTYPSSLAKRTDYEAWPGTSMATPFVTATVALLLAKKPSATHAQIRNALRRGAEPIGGQRGFTEELGYGRLNLPRTLAAI
jgi:hypothetical protein